MRCPNCQEIPVFAEASAGEEMKKAVFYNTGVDYCPKCLGVWFEQDELRQAKDERDKTLNWLDVDLWSDKTKFQVAKTAKICPQDFVPLYEVKYNGSNVKVDLCDVCRGVWLDRGEFKKIIAYLKAKKADEILRHYLASLIQEGVEIFVGPETFREEVDDFIMLVKLFNDKFIIQHPIISKIILGLPK